MISTSFSRPISTIPARISSHSRQQPQVTFAAKFPSSPENTQGYLEVLGRMETKLTAKKDVEDKLGVYARMGMAGPILKLVQDKLKGKLADPAKVEAALSATRALIEAIHKDPTIGDGVDPYIERHDQAMKELFGSEEKIYEWLNKN